MAENRTSQRDRASVLAPYSSFLSMLDEARLYPNFRAITSGVNEPVCVVDGREVLQFSANNYLSLSEHPAVKASATEAITRYGLGPGGARAIAGNTAIGEALERDLARWTGMEDVVTFPTGYMANVSVIRALMDPVLSGLPHGSSESVVFLDEFVHGSLFDGTLLSDAKAIFFRHGNLENLRKKMKRYDFPHKLIVTEGVYSLEGEITDLRPYVELARETNALLLVDDAHGVGLFGERGSGVLELQGLSDPRIILMGSMDKALGGIGGFLAGSKSTIRFLRVACRSALFSSALPCVFAASTIAAIREIEASPEVRRSLFVKAARLRDALRTAGFTVLGPDNLPAIAVLLGDENEAIAFSEALWERGIFCPAVRFPAAHKGQARLRIVVMANHTEAQVDLLIEEMADSRRALEPRNMLDRSDPRGRSRPRQIPRQEKNQGDR